MKLWLWACISVQPTAQQLNSLKTKRLSNSCKTCSDFVLFCWLEVAINLQISWFYWRRRTLQRNFEQLKKQLIWELWWTSVVVSKLDLHLTDMEWHCKLMTFALLSKPIYRETARRTTMITTWERKQQPNSYSATNSQRISIEPSSKDSMHFIKNLCQVIDLIIWLVSLSEPCGAWCMLTWSCTTTSDRQQAHLWPLDD